MLAEPGDEGEEPPEREAGDDEGQAEAEGIGGEQRRAEVRERIVNGGGEVVAGTPEEFAATMRVEMAKWGKLIRDAGIRGE